MSFRPSLIRRRGGVLIALFFAFVANTGLAEPLRVALSPDYMPLAFKQDGKLTGMEIALAEAVSTKLKIKTRFVELPLDQLIPALNSGKIDVIMSGLSITEERSRQVLFADPYMEIGQMGIIRIDDLVEWSQPRTLLSKGKKIGVKRGTTGEQFVESELPKADVIRFENIDAGTDALSNRQIDIFIHDAPTIWRLTANFATEKPGLMGLYRPLTDEFLAWAVRREDGALASALNRALDAIKADGTLNTVKGKWIPVQVKVR
jgi:polar amino acid transport system substrate-binding protein